MKRDARSSLQIASYPNHLGRLALRMGNLSSGWALIPCLCVTNQSLVLASHPAKKQCSSCLDGKPIVGGDGVGPETGCVVCHASLDNSNILGKAPEVGQDVMEPETGCSNIFKHMTFVKGDTINM